MPTQTTLPAEKAAKDLRPRDRDNNVVTQGALNALLAELDKVDAMRAALKVVGCRAIPKPRSKKCGTCVVCAALQGYPPEQPTPASAIEGQGAPERVWLRPVDPNRPLKPLYTSRDVASERVNESSVEYVHGDRHAKLVEAVYELLADIECYCADNVAFKGPCPDCNVKTLLQGNTSRVDQRDRLRALLKPDAWHCQKCGEQLTYHPEGSEAYSCEKCEAMWPAHNIALFAYADLTDESFAIPSAAPYIPNN